MNSRTPGADSGTGTLAAFRLPRESGSPAGSATRPRKGGGGSSPGLGTPGLAAATPSRAPRNSVRVARHRAELRPQLLGGNRHRAGSDPPGDKSWGWHHQAGLSLGPHRGAAGRGEGYESRRPSPAALPGTC